MRRCLAARPTATGEKHRALVNHHPRPRVGANVRRHRTPSEFRSYYEFGTVRMEGHPENTAEYIWGDKTLRTVRCKTCGCATHWEPLAPAPGAKHGVNLNNFDPRLQESIHVRRFDGADTWTFID